MDTWLSLYVMIGEYLLFIIYFSQNIVFITATNDYITFFLLYLLW